MVCATCVSAMSLLCFCIAHDKLGSAHEGIAVLLWIQVVDNSSAFRMTEGVPLVIPEVNPDAMKGMRYGQGGIIANPNCSTIIALMAVTPLHKAAKVLCLCAASCVTINLVFPPLECGYLKQLCSGAACKLVFHQRLLCEHEINMLQHVACPTGT